MNTKIYITPEPLLPGIHSAIPADNWLELPARIITEIK